MSSEPPYGYDPRQQQWQNQPPGTFPPGYEQGQSQQAPFYPQPGQPGYTQGYEQGTYPPPPPPPPPPVYPPQPGPYEGQYSQPLYPGATPAPGYGAPAMPSIPMPGYAMASIPVPMAVPISDPGGGQAVTGLILGIVGLVFCWLGILSFCAIVPVAINVVGIIMSALGRRSTQKRGMATAGLVLSIIGLVLTIGFFVLYIAIRSAASAIPAGTSY